MLYYLYTIPIIQKGKTWLYFIIFPEANDMKTKLEVENMQLKKTIQELNDEVDMLKKKEGKNKNA